MFDSPKRSTTPGSLRVHCLWISLPALPSGQAALARPALAPTPSRPLTPHTDSRQTAVLSAGLTFWRQSFSDPAIFPARPVHLPRTRPPTHPSTCPSARPAPPAARLRLPVPLQGCRRAPIGGLITLASESSSAHVSATACPCPCSPPPLPPPLLSSPHNAPLGQPRNPPPCAPGSDQAARTDRLADSTCVCVMPALVHRS